MGMIGNTLAQGLISGANIQDGTVDTPDIKDSAVTAAKIASAVITPGKLSTGAPTWDTSGNLGLGVTPVSWSAYKSLDFQGGSVASGSTTSFELWCNSFYNGTNSVYRVTGAASLYNQGSGAHRWYTAASGTAGNAITFTQAMTLDASGNLLVGGTSNSGGLKILASDLTVQLGLLPYAAGSIGYVGTWTNHALGFATNGTEKARIDSSGNLLVGTTSNSDYSSTVKFYSVSSTYAGAFKSTGGASFTTLGIWNTASSGTISLVNFLVGAGSSTGSITSNGTTTTYGTSSDYRLKENIVPMTGALATVAQLKPCTYTWKSNGSSGQGFIAHELQAIVPDAVTGEKDAVNEDGSIKTQNIDTSFLVATLTAAIQELKAEFDAYKASHP